MTGSNHVVTGSIIATMAPQPLVAIPLAVVSHFVLDALPHYGENNERSWLSKHFNYVLAVDGALVSIFLLIILFSQPANWLLILFCGALAVIPDLVWLPYYLADLHKQELTHGPFARFSKWIQWGERPWGIYIEAVVFVILITVFFKIAY